MKEARLVNHLTLQDWLALLILGVAISTLSALMLSTPGYMDAEYYYATGKQIAGGEGFREPFIWNFLDDPEGIPHPSHHYWMPLPSILAALGIALFGESFRAAQLPFTILTALLPMFTAWLALYLNRKPGDAFQSGVLAALPGFFLPYLVTTDAFSAYIFVGSGTLLLMARAEKKKGWFRWIVVGVGIGLAHLTRADGLLLFLPALAALWFSRRDRWLGLGAVVFGYGLVMSPWWIRNMQAFGGIFPPGTTRSLWQRTYDELFAYPASRLSFQHWITAGVERIIMVRFAALWTNIQRLIAENGLIFLGPLMVLGARRLWHHALVRLTFLYLFTLLFVLSFVFPFAGARGGFFHSSIAVLPVFWTLAPVGLREVVAWGAKWRGWSEEDAYIVFSRAMVVMALALTIGLFAAKVFSPPAWDSPMRSYKNVGEMLLDLTEDPGIVMVNNPPGFHLATGLPAVVVPDGDPLTLREVARRYGVGWIVLDENHPGRLTDLYQDPTSVPWLELREKMDRGGVLFLEVRTGEGD
jgi:4-amino-4-deoxy-L-arabinose transferase-like glycosyltransferase